MGNNGFHAAVASNLDTEGFVEVEVLQYEKDTHGAEGVIRVRSDNGGYGAHNVWLDIKGAKRLRKQLKRAIEFLES